ncbi:hypothetical protein N7454_008892 [Penicillium verhagenii]|nr:hypothetical protein N7454_008892 [Penicillium verhagenii]
MSSEFATLAGVGHKMSPFGVHDNHPVPHMLRCANWSPGTHYCKVNVTKACPKCLLPGYCSLRCMEADSARHRFHCKSDLGKETWKATWPAFGDSTADAAPTSGGDFDPAVPTTRDTPKSPPTSSSSSDTDFPAAGSPSDADIPTAGNASNTLPASGSTSGAVPTSRSGKPRFATRRLWGRTPAVDMLNLKMNEGANFEGDLRLLLEDSADLASAFLTFAELPKTFTGSIEFTINNREDEIVLRHIIILLLAFGVKDYEGTHSKKLVDVHAAIDCMIHIWYSAFISKGHLDILQNFIEPLFEKVKDKLRNIRTKTPDVTTMDHGWNFKSVSIQATLSIEKWNKLFTFIEQPAGLTFEKASHHFANPMKCVMTEHLRNHRFCRMPPSCRLALAKYYEDGLMLPYGYPRHEFTEPNPTLWHDADTPFKRGDGDPLDGWNQTEVLNVWSGPAINDIYGKLWIHVSSVLLCFFDGIKDLNVTFKVLNARFNTLPGILEDTKFDRIDTSNIIDRGRRGAQATLGTLSNLLQPRHKNIHAVMITRFENAVPALSRSKNLKSVNPPKSSASYKKLQSFFEVDFSQALPFGDPETIRILVTQRLVGRYDAIWNQYVKEEFLVQIGHECGLQPKKKHTIIGEWPYAMKLPFGRSGTEKRLAGIEFHQLVAAGISPMIRCVEWQKDEDEWDRLADYVLESVIPCPRCGSVKHATWECCLRREHRRLRKLALKKAQEEGLEKERQRSREQEGEEEGDGEGQAQGDQ